jgi:outer membrane immunogenic protein
MRGSLPAAAFAVPLSLPFCVQAADLYGRPAYPPSPYYAPALPARSPWNGFYVGGFLGASIGQQKLDEHGANQFFATTGTGTATLSSPTSDPETLFGFDDHKTGFTGGGFAGYSYQFGRMVIGAEADLAVKKLESSAGETVTASATYTGGSTGDPLNAGRTEFFTGSVRQNWDASARLRLGGLITPSILLYATGGAALGSVDSAFSYSATTVYNQVGGGSITHTTFGTGNWSDTRIGWTAGGGIETALGPNWKARAEYRFSDLGSFSKDAPLTRTTSSNALPNAGSAAAAADVSASFHTLRLGVAYSF